MVLPTMLQLLRKFIELAHENHLSIAKTIALLREKVYFVNMEAKVTAKRSECILSAAVLKSPPPQSLELSILLRYPWHTINIDFLGQLPNPKYLLVAID